MLLVLAAPGDLLAETVCTRAANKGLSAHIVHSTEELVLSVQLQPAAKATCDLSLRLNGRSVSAVFNRYCVPTAGAGEDDAFIVAEDFAALWAALALFPGTVVNRPTRQGMSFNIDVLSLRRRMDATCFPRMWLSRRLPPPSLIQPGIAVNVTALADGYFLGRLDESHWSGEEEEWKSFIFFRPNAVRRLAYVNGHFLDIRSGELVGTDMSGLRDIERILQELNIDFSGLAIETAAPRPVLLSINSYPSLKDLGKAAGPAVDLLLERLT